jgi:hypothetical protein
MEEIKPVKCKYCGQALKPFSSMPTWISKKMHKKCYKKVNEINELNEFIKRMNMAYDTNVKMLNISK